MRIAIIGAGIGGMTLALALHAAGISDVDISSPHRPSRNWGLALTFSPTPRAN
jgi:2-polyprenyl-6-methoxyphenol hydroxylase-like FAD-dependent oxidoreductase